MQRAIAAAVATAAQALGLYHGPIHAECRVNARGVFVLEVAARPIGGLCAQALRFTGPDAAAIGLEELLLRHALGEAIDDWSREREASGVMMIPIPSDGIYRRVDGVDDALRVAGRARCADHGQARSTAGAAAGRRQLSGVHLRARASSPLQSNARFAMRTRNCRSSSIARLR